MKTVLLVPGFYEDIHSENYASLISGIESKGYSIRFVEINWKRTTINDWTKQLRKIYNEYDNNNIILAGFSYGAMTAFSVAAELNPAELWLFSLSPYFYEDLKSSDMKKSWLASIGHRRVSTFADLIFSKLAKQITCKTILFAGQIEIDKFKITNYRINEASKLIRNSKLYIIPEVGHDVTNEKYVAAILNEV